MRCSTAKRYIDLKLDGELNPRHADELSRHLASCQSCRAWQEQAIHFDAFMQNAPVSVLPTWVHAQIMDKVKFQMQKRPGFVQKLHLATASAVVAVFFSFWAGTMVGVSTFNTGSQTSESTTVSVSSLSFGENTIVDGWDTAEANNE